MGKYDRTRTKIKMLERGILHGQTPLSYLELGLLYQVVKEYDKAEKSFKKVIDTLPDNIYPRFLLLRLYEARGDQAKGTILAEEMKQINNPKMSIALRMELQKICFWNVNHSENIVA